MPTPADIYAAYPRKEGKLAALKAIDKALHIVDGDTLLKAVQDYAVAVGTWPAEDYRFIPLPATWFNQGRWEDDRRNWYRNRPVRVLRTVN